jgi:hypothetical protein
MWWSHADAATYRDWITQAGLHIESEDFVPKQTAATNSSGPAEPSDSQPPSLTPDPSLKPNPETPGDPTGRKLTESYAVEQIIEICMLVGQYAMLAGAFNSLGVRIEPGFPAAPSATG